MPQPARPTPSGSRIQAACVAAFLDAIASHEVRVLAGLDATTLADLLAAAALPRRPVLHLDLAGPGDGQTRRFG